MFYSLKTDCYFRKYVGIGYIVRPIVSIEEVVDENGSLFIEELSYEPRRIDDIVDSLSDKFDCSDVKEIRKDATEFFSTLVRDGFLNCSENIASFQCSGFEYSTLEGKLAYTNIKAQLEESSSHFLSEYFKTIPFLQTFHIELTSKCNERCVHCYIPHENKTTEIEYKVMMDTLLECKKMNVLTLIFSGGEPMLHPHFSDFLKKAKDLDFNVTVLSNLILLNDEIIEALTYKHASCVNVSLYSMDPEIHDKITTIPDSQEKTKRNILRLIENDIPVQINLPVMKQNKDSFYEVIKWGQEHKCSVITDYLIMARSDRTVDNLDNRLSNEDLSAVIKKLVNSDVVFQSNIQNAKANHTNIEIKPDDRVCGVGMSTLCMVTSGDIYPCAGWQKYVCGNIKDMSLSDIWEKSPQVEYLRTIRQKDFKQCLNCDDKNFCLMCMSRNSNEDSNGDIFEIPQITCEAARIHHKIVEEYVNESSKNK